jgi:hypothetical protein
LKEQEEALAALGLRTLKHLNEPKIDIPDEVEETVRKKVISK